MEIKRAPCYECPKCRLNPADWGKSQVSAACKSSCVDWEGWFYTEGWKAVTEPLRKLKRGYHG